MIASLKKIFRGSKDSDTSKLLAGAKNEREALLLLKESRSRDEERREKANQRLKEIGDTEQKLMDEGKQDGIASSRKMHLVRLIKQGREEQRDLLYKLEKIYNPRLKALQAHIQSLETVIEVKNEPIPEIETIENTSIKAKNMMEDLDSAVELVSAIQKGKENPGRDPEDQEILDELSTLAEEDRLKKHEEETKRKKEEDEKEKKKLSKKKEKTVSEKPNSWEKRLKAKMKEIEEEV